MSEAFTRFGTAVGAGGAAPRTSGRNAESWSRDDPTERSAVHRSRLSTLLIDVPLAQAQTAAGFWSAALGVAAVPVPGEEQFTSLPGAAPGLVVAVQSVNDGSRYHVDLETDDVEAETARLVELGAVEQGRWLDCRTLRVPGGQLICVIPVHSDPDEFAREAHVWGSGIALA